VDFPAVMARVRRLRARIAPADGHRGTEATGADVYQGMGVFTSPNTVEVNGRTLRFKKCVIATGGRPSVPSDVPGLLDAPYTTNEGLFNLEALPPRLVILGAGVVALEMAQAFSLLGSDVTVVGRTERLLASRGADAEAAELLRRALEDDGVAFVAGRTTRVETLREPAGTALPLLRVHVAGAAARECECLLVAAGRSANVERLGLEAAGVDYAVGAGIAVDAYGRSVSNADVHAAGDCAAGTPRLTHVAGEMAKVAVQNALAGDSWRLDALVLPAVAYTHPEYATVGTASQEMADAQGVAVDVYRTGLEGNDRAILEGSDVGFCKIVVRRGTDEIVGATIVADRAGEMINEVTLAMKAGVGLGTIGRNVHPYPTTGEAVMLCGLQYINQHWTRFD